MICGPGGPGRTAHGGLGQTALPLMLGSLPIRDELRPGGLGQTALPLMLGCLPIRDE
jgi:hypothetical protein